MRALTHPLFRCVPRPLFLAAALGLCALTAHAAPAPAAPAPAANPFLKQRLGSLAVAQLFAPGAAQLSKADQRVAWHLALAAHAGEPIQYDQLGWDNLELKHLLECVHLFGAADPKAPFAQKLSEYLVRFYGQSGNHDLVTGAKFVPAFTPAELEQHALAALKAGAPLAAQDEAGVKAQLARLQRALFDATFEPQLTAKAPPPGKDLLTASSNTAYGRDVTLEDLKGFQEKHSLNSRVVKENGKLVEQVFRAGTPDKKLAPGLYAAELARVIAHLEAAKKHAGKQQQAALSKLVRYFQTGSAADWDAYNIAWLKANPPVDANLGFIETYVDARGQKGQWEALVNYQDPTENKVMELLAKKAQYFEDRMPWPAQYRRKKIALPVAKAIHLLASYPTPPAGINLPNEQHIRQKHGSKSVLVANTMETAAAIKRLPLALEFSRTPEEKADAQKYSVLARKWLVAFHEVTGHASGQTDPKVKDPAAMLKEYDNTLEEARADLVALWHAFDPALAELSPEHEKVAHQMYRDFLVEGLTNLARVEKGDEFEEDHQRGHQMTVQFLVEKGAVKQVVQPAEGAAPGKGAGRSYYVAVDDAKMREGVGELLSKLMVIKATGDYEGIKALVQKYGIKFDPKLRDEVVARVKAADVPSVIFMLSPRLVPTLDAKGEVEALAVQYEQGFVDQHLERSVLGRAAPTEASRLAVQLTSAPPSSPAAREALKEAFRKLGPPASATTSLPVR